MWSIRNLIIFIGLISLLLTVGCLPELKPPKELSKQQGEGWKIFTKRCAACHTIKGKGGKQGGDLTSVAKKRDAKWLKKFLQNPKTYVPKATMLPTELDEKQLNDLISYLQTLK